MRNFLLRFLLFLICVSSVLLVFPSIHIKADTVASGLCGDNISWCLDNSGILTISGSGEMYDWNSTKSVPWNSYKTKIQSVVISDNVSSIGNYAFSECGSVRSIQIPNTVTTIGDYAFYECTCFAFRITLPESVNYIGSYAFYHCSGLSSIKIPTGVKIINDHTFSYCSNLSNVQIPEGVTSIGNAAFISCQELSFIDIPDSVTFIDDYAFDFCSSLTEITIPNGVERIGYATFYCCTELKTISLPDSVTQIDEMAFYGCSDLERIKIPDNTRIIGKNAFNRCTKLKSIIVNQEAFSNDAFPSYTKDVFHFYYDVIYDFYGCGSVSAKTRSFGTEVLKLSIDADDYYCLDDIYIHFGDDVIDIEITDYANTFVTMPDSDSTVFIDGVFKFRSEGNVCGKNLIWEFNDNGTLYISGTGKMADFYGTGELGPCGPNDDVPWKDFRLDIISVVLSDGVTSIGANAFAGCKNLKSVYFSQSITSINEYAFWDSGIVNLTIPDSVTEIANGAFFECKKLQKISLSNNLEIIDCALFYDCTNLINLSIPDTITSICDSAFCNCSSLSDISLPSQLTYIGNNAFYSCTSLKKIKIPYGVKEIGLNAFSNCKNLSSVVLKREAINGSFQSVFNGIKPEYHFYYNVTYSTEGNGSITGNIISYGTDVLEISVLPDANHSIDNVSISYSGCIHIIESNSSGKYIYTMPDAEEEVVISASFKAEIYELRSVDCENGTFSLNKTIANPGEEIIVSTFPCSGYRVGAIIVNGETISGNSFIMPAQDVVVEVEFVEAIIINSQPVDYMGTAGTSAKFSVQAVGNELTYQWQLKKGSSWANLTAGGATTSTMTIKVDDSKNGKVYRCVITDAAGAEIVTDSVSITVKQPSNAIMIKTQPANYAGPVGSSAKFTVVAEGSGLKYQWQLKKGSSWSNLSTGGATTSTMTIKVDESRNGKVYRCIITDANGEELATESVSITVKNPSIVINSQPSNYVGLAGSTAKFTVSAEGSGLQYQWQLKKGSSWANLSTGGATTSTMTIKVDDSKNGKVYRCLITSADGEELATESVSITVKQPSNAIVINTQPTDFEGTVGSTAKFTVAAQGNGLSYQWQLKKGKSWSNLTSGGATTSTMSIKVDTSKDGKTYRCVITDSEGNEVASEEVTIHVVVPVAASVPAVAANEAPVVVSNDAPSVTVPEVEATASDEIA